MSYPLPLTFESGIKSRDNVADVLWSRITRIVPQAYRD